MYISKDGQTLIDCVITGAGQIDNLFDILKSNPEVPLTGYLTPKTEIVIPAGIENKQKVVDYFKGAKFDVNNNSIINNDEFLEAEQGGILEAEQGNELSPDEEDIGIGIEQSESALEPEQGFGDSAPFPG